jgi:hypothetical protein
MRLKLIMGVFFFPLSLPSQSRPEDWSWPPRPPDRKVRAEHACTTHCFCKKGGKRKLCVETSVVFTLKRQVVKENKNMYMYGWKCEPKINWQQRCIKNKETETLHPPVGPLFCPFGADAYVQKLHRSKDKTDWTNDGKKVMAKMDKNKKQHKKNRTDSRQKKKRKKTPGPICCNAPYIVAKPVHRSLSSPSIV